MENETARFTHAISVSFPHNLSISQRQFMLKLYLYFSTSKIIVNIDFFGNCGGDWG